MSRCVGRILAAVAALLVPALAGAQTPAGKVSVVTSFSKDLTDPIKKAFEAATPGVTLDVQNRNTNAGVKYLEETKANNQVDLFWASAPDAFESLKGKSLLQAYAPKATGIPKTLGQFPINDPDGFYLGFAASGYGVMWNERYVKANKLPEPKEWQDLAGAAYFDHVSMAAPSPLRNDAPDDRDDPARRRLGQGLGYHQIDRRQFPRRHRAFVWRSGSGQFRSGRIWHRHRFLCVGVAGLGFPGEIHLSFGDDHCAGQCRNRRQRSEQGRRGGFRRIPAVAGWADDPVRAQHPAAAGQYFRLREGAGGLSQSVHGSAPELHGEI